MKNANQNCGKTNKQDFLLQHGQKNILTHELITNEI